jgi:NAD(P)-dependent dehydrogenase (short-subunit alcohol dehydrogenase family)
MGTNLGRECAVNVSRGVLVTGASRGVGAMTAKAFAAAGDRVVLHCRGAVDQANAVLAELPGEGHSVVTADLGDSAGIPALVEEAAAALGRIDVLVNNAALYAPLHEQKFTEIDVDLWDKVMAVNLRGPFLMAKHVAPEMAKRRYGKIINIGSGTAVRGIPWIMHYVTSKGGVTAMTRSMSRELGDDGIRVNTLMPGFTLSDTIVSQNPGHVETARNRAIQSRALKRDALPEDLLGTLIFLASADSDFITGQMIAVDGGNVNT